MKPVAESSKAADTERFEREVGVWHPPKKERAASLPPSSNKPTATSAYQPNNPKGVQQMDLSTTYPQGHSNDHA